MPRLLGAPGYEVSISSDGVTPSGHCRAGGGRVFFHVGTLGAVCK